ncbi:MAG TPA: hypothetical protein VM253_02905 [Candidatus Limnocylindrales bacterium]|jgi:hypothetical protein|nr:hypothetical protein [Candidatus Limnocylindrales bacterium]
MAPLVRYASGMNDFERQPGAIDDPGMKGGIDPQVDQLPPGSSADDTGGPGEPEAAELDLPGPDDPVAWNYVEAETLVVGPDGEELGRVAAMLGTEDEGIFHGVAVTPYDDGRARVVPADAVTALTTAKVEIAYDADQLAAAEEHRPAEAG